MAARLKIGNPGLYALFFLNFYIFLGALTVKREVTLVSDLLFGDSLYLGVKSLLVGLFGRAYLTLDAVVIAAVVFFLVTMADKFRRVAIVAMLGVLLVFALVLTQFRYFTEVGTFYDGEQLIFGIRNFSGLLGIYQQSGMSLAFKLGLVMIGLGMVLVFLKPRWQQVLVRLMSLTGVIALAVNVSSSRAHDVFMTAPVLSTMVGGLFSGDLIEGGGEPYHYEPVVPEVSRANGMNVVLVVLESARARSIPGFTAVGVQAEMPALAALGNDGVRFDRAYTTMSHTSKALIGILCGTHPVPEARVAEYERGKVPVNCLPEILRQANYRSLFIQTAAGEFEERNQLIPGMGFDSGLYRADIRADYKPAGYFGLDEAALVSPIKRWWSQHAGQAKFLTVLTSMSHHPYAMPGQERAGSADLLASYHQTLSYTDVALGQIFAYLRKQGEWGRTLVIVTGDHGEGFGEHAERIHDAVPYEEATRVPLIVIDPRDRFGRRGSLDPALRQHVDILPTVLDAVGISHHAQLPGLSLASAAGHDAIQTHCFWINSCLARHEKERKYIYFPARNELQLYDLARDPYEQNNMAASLSALERRDAIQRIISFRAGVLTFYRKGSD